MGEVYAARDSKLDRPVALKLLPAAVSHDFDRRTPEFAAFLARHPG